jgi:hypothetical protein
MYQYILVHHVPVTTYTHSSHAHLISNQVLSRVRSWIAVSFLFAVSLTVRPLRCGLLLPNCHSHELTSYKLRDSAHHIEHILSESHVEILCRGWFIQLDHSSVPHEPCDVQLQLLKGVEETKGYYSQRSSGPALYVLFLGIFSILWTDGR